MLYKFLSSLSAIFLCGKDLTFFFFYLQLWDIRRKGCIFTYKGHNLTVNSLKFSPDGQWIASAGEDCNVKVGIHVQLMIFGIVLIMLKQIIIIE